MRPDDGYSFPASLQCIRTCLPMRFQNHSPSYSRHIEWLSLLPFLSLSPLSWSVKHLLNQAMIPWVCSNEDGDDDLERAIPQCDLHPIIHCCFYCWRTIHLSAWVVKCAAFLAVDDDYFRWNLIETFSRKTSFASLTTHFSFISLSRSSPPVPWMSFVYPVLSCNLLIKLILFFNWFVTIKPKIWSIQDNLRCPCLPSWWWWCDSDELFPNLLVCVNNLPSVKLCQICDTSRTSPPHLTHLNHKLITHNGWL